MAAEFTDLTQKRMTKEAAQALHEKIIDGARTFAYSTGNMLLQMQNERGWEALGHASLKEYMNAVRGETGLSSMYNWLDTATVNDNLSRATGRVIELPITHALVLKDLEPEQQVLAFTEATEGGKEIRPTVKVFERVVKKVAPAPKKKRKAATRDDSSDGWTKEDLAKDTELAMAFASLSILGDSDVKAIRNGTIGLKRADILFWAKLPKPKVLEIVDLVMGNRWTPAEAVKFVNSMPDENSTVEELQNYCLATKGKFYTATINGFTITVKANRAALRK